MSRSTPGTVGGSIKIHPLPPDGFNPRSATPLELRRYGLPQRPDPAIHSQLAARWDEIFSRKLAYITPDPSRERPLSALSGGSVRSTATAAVAVNHHCAA
jgi:hypothetical protein